MNKRSKGRSNKQMSSGSTPSSIVKMGKAVRKQLTGVKKNMQKKQKGMF